jgi:hypothetical protein
MTTLRACIFLIAAAVASPAVAQTRTTLKPARHDDSLLNGVLIGAAAGAAGAWAFTRANCGPKGYDDECTANVALYATIVGLPAGAAAGAFIDWLIHDDKPRPQQKPRWSVTPVIGRKQVGVFASISGWKNTKFKKR